MFNQTHIWSLSSFFFFPIC